MDRYEHLWNVVYAAVMARTSQREKAVSSAELAIEDCKAADKRRSEDDANTAGAIGHKRLMELLNKPEEIFTLSTFSGMCHGGHFTDEDGDFYFSSETKPSEVKVLVSDIISGNINTAFTHVAWFKTES